MPKVTAIRPLDQPMGTRRLLADLRTHLKDPAFDDFRICVAYARSGPLLRLAQELKAWSAAGRKVRGIFGIDQGLTSIQALRFALSQFDESYVTSYHPYANPKGVTFHPKVYAFLGAKRALVYQGSNNLTVGGTETNFEAGVWLDFQLPEEQAALDATLTLWDDLLPAAFPLTQALDDPLLLKLQADGVLLDEHKPKANRGGFAPRQPQASLPPAPFKALPASSIPKESLPKAAKPSAKPSAAATTPATTPSGVPVTAVAAEALAIEVTPQDNGEVYLSKLAMTQNPAFFGWPFTGTSTPKKPTNPGYPQRLPDPLVNVSAYDATGKLVHSEQNYGLNMVYYTKRSEIRVTVKAAIRKVMPDYSILVLSLSPTGPHDYDFEVFAPGSPQHAQYAKELNQTLPSGGKGRARKMGWL